MRIGVVVDVDAVAGIGLEDVARLEPRHRLARDQLEVGAARQHARREVAPAAAPADDRDEAAHAGADLADLDRRADLDLEVGEARAASAAPSGSAGIRRPKGIGRTHAGRVQRLARAARRER